MTNRPWLAWLALAPLVVLVAALAPHVEPIATIAAGLAVSAAVAATFGGVRTTPLDAPLAACALALALAHWRSPMQESNPLPWACWLLVVAGTARGAAAPRNARVLVAALVALGTTILAYAAVVALVAPTSARAREFPLVSHWGMYPEMGILACIVLPLWVAAALSAPPAPWRRAAAFVLLAGGAAGLFVSFARAAWIAAAAGLMVALAVGRLRLAAIARLVVGLALLALLLVPFAARHFGEGSVLKGRVAVTSRVRAWESARMLWSEHTWTGWGPGTWRAAYRLRFGPSDEPAATHSHQMALQAGTEVGLVGLLAASWLLLQAFGATSARIRTGTSAAAAAFDAGVLGALVAVVLRMQVDFFDPTTTMVRPLLCVGLLVGLAGRAPAPRAMEELKG